MQTTIQRTIRFSRIKILLVIILIIGIFFRFIYLDKKIYWDDEVFTSLRVSGYTSEEFEKQLYTHIVSFKDIQSYQFPNPERTTFDTIKGLATEEPQLPPLYFLLTRFWVQLFGNSVLVTRSLSAVFNILTIAVIYWLCRELFESPLVGWMAMALIALSPFHLLYAQAARQYSLWGLITVLSSVVFLRARRINNKFSWVLYSITVALGLYTLPLFFLVTFGHGIYMIAIEKFQFNKTVKNYLLSFAVGTLAFFPWMILIILSADKARQTTNWIKYSFKYGIPELVFSWLNHIARLFLDLANKFNFTYTNPFPYIIPVIAFVALTFYAVYYLCRHTAKETWLFILSLIVTSVLPLILLDLILGGRRSGITRYLIPSYIGLQISVAYLLATQVTSHWIQLWQQKLWRLLIVVLFSLGIASYTVISPAQVWWNNGPSKIGQIPAIIPVVNQTEQPLIISDAKWSDLVPLSYSLKPNVKFQLVRQQELPNIPQGFSDYFLYKPSQDLREGLEKRVGYQIKPVYQSNNIWLWRLSKK
ncbi:glycosyltransferase family 39 protein [Nostoc sp. UHCC 0702]|nr:glycosyltransferase family 39 protein [Nostoc sp. UHCC 0702]